MKSYQNTDEKLKEKMNSQTQSIELFDLSKEDDCNRLLEILYKEQDDKKRDTFR